MTYEGIVNPLDFKELLVGHLAGSMEIFIFLMVIAIVYFGARFRIPIGALLMLIATFGAFMILWTTNIIILVVLIGGAILGVLLSRLIK